MQQAGLVYLRARWYAAGSSTFTSRDPFAGYAQQPYSLHPYQYAYSDPLRWTDPSGRFVECDVVINYQNPADWGVKCRFWTKEEWKAAWKETIGCPSSPYSSPYLPPPKDIGYLEGGDASVYWAVGGMTGAVEVVYDLYDFEFGLFASGSAGAYVLWGAEISAYMGIVEGWSSYKKDPGVHNYGGEFHALAGSVTLPFIRLVNVSGAYTLSKETGGTGRLEGKIVGIGGEAPLGNPSPIGGSWTVGYSQLLSTIPFHAKGVGQQDRTDAALFAAFILSRPLLTIQGRAFAVYWALENGRRWEYHRTSRP
jgi:RHS repeat-associated protein